MIKMKDSDNEDDRNKIEKLIAKNFKLSISLGLIFLTIILILPVLNEFASDIMLKPVFGNFTVTLIYTALFIFIMGWIIPLYYTLETDKREREYEEEHK